MRNLIGLLAVGAVIAACGPSGQQPHTSGDRLYEAVGQSIVVIDSSSHSAESRLPLGTPTSDWKHLYSIVGDSIVDTNPSTGDTQNSLRVGAGYQLPAATHSGLPGGLSPAGHWLVLQAADARSTHMAVIDTQRFLVTDRFDLAGRFNFDAISEDGQRLFLIQYLNGREYYVRLFNIATNSLDANIVVDKSDGNQAMSGLRLSGVAAPDGSMLFSMYVRANESPFIHALSLGGPFAFCLDLPGEGYTQGHSAMRWSLAMKANGSKLYAFNGATGVVVEVESSSQNPPQILRTGHVNTGSSGAEGPGAMVLSNDGRTLVAASNAGIVWVDTADLQVRMQALAEWRVSSLGLSSDGTKLFAVNDAGQVAELSMTSGEVIARFDPGVGAPLALMRVASA